MLSRPGSRETGPEPSVDGTFKHTSTSAPATHFHHLGLDLLKVLHPPRMEPPARDKVFTHVGLKVGRREILQPRKGRTSKQTAAEPSPCPWLQV